MSVRRKRRGRRPQTGGWVKKGGEKNKIDLFSGDSGGGGREEGGGRGGERELYRGGRGGNYPK